MVNSLHVESATCFTARLRIIRREQERVRLPSFGSYLIFVLRNVRSTRLLIIFLACGSLSASSALSASRSAISRFNVTRTTFSVMLGAPLTATSVVRLLQFQSNVPALSCLIGLIVIA
jgi:hypothetical protein